MSNSMIAGGHSQDIQPVRCGQEWNHRVQRVLGSHPSEGRQLSSLFEIEYVYMQEWDHSILYGHMQK